MRGAIRAGIHTGHTSGLAPGFIQGNIVILPERYAADFERFCKQNPKPCPLLALSRPGDPSLPALGQDIDIRHDLPRYRVFRDGKLVEEASDIESVWRPDLVTFVLGCSFTFEQPLIAAGIPLRHVAERRNVAMFRTKLPTTPAGPFHGPMIVSMRPLAAPDVIRAIEITARFPDMHGTPIHFGTPEQLGIRDLSQPDYGDPVEVRSHEYPVFWACGVTSQAAVEAARPDFCITHAPGCMLITERQHA